MLRPSTLEGFALNDHALRYVVRRWTIIRLTAGVLALVLVAFMALVGAPNMWLALGALIAIVADGWRGLRDPRPFPSLLMDATAVWLAADLVELPPVPLGIAFTVFWMEALLMTRSWARLVSIVWSATCLAMAAELDLFPAVGLSSTLATTIGVVAGLYFAMLMFGVMVAVISALQDANARLSTTLDDLERLVDSKDEFVASISHELRTPLTAVVGFSNELDTCWPDFEESLRREMVAAIARQSQDLAHIIEDLLVSARADTGTLSVLCQPMDVVAVTREVASERGTRVECGCEPVMAMADPLRFRQIVRNLITNAHRYGGADRWIEIEACDTGPTVRVCDNGSGVEETAVERIFLAYETAHETVGLPGAVGLGLAVARRLAVMMDGDLTYRREESVTVFECRLAPFDAASP